jgi:hypothetical protein
MREGIQEQTMARLPRVDWVKMGTRQGVAADEFAFCARCKVGMSLVLPASIDDVVKAINKFVRVHATCKETANAVKESAA